MKRFLLFSYVFFFILCIFFSSSQKVNAGYYCVCGDLVCDTVCNEQATCPGDCGTLSGVVSIDSANNTCGAGATRYSAGAVVTLYAGAVPAGNDTADALGAYNILNVNSGSRVSVLSNTASYSPVAVQYNGGAWGTAGLTGFTYGPFNLSGSQTLNWCISNRRPWYQVDKGDVRMGSIGNRVPNNPPTTNAASDANYPGVYFSSNSPSDFSPGQVSTKGWRVDNEFSYSKDSSNRNGTVAYSYYKNRASDTNQVILPVPGCTNGNGAICNGALTNLPTGVYEFDAGGTGRLTITGYTQSPGAHVTILVNGTVAIASDIQVAQGVNNLLIVAAKRDIIIGMAVGQVSPSSTTINIAGIFSAEGKFTIDGNGCPAGVPDKRLNISGAVVANALKPFSVGNTGILDNKRSLCANDTNYPSVNIQTRPDFVTQLSDFYRVNISKFREVQP